MNSIDRKFAKMSRKAANSMTGTGTGLKRNGAKRRIKRK